MSDAYDAEKLERVEKQLARDTHRLAELYDEITSIVKRIHLLGMEQGAIKTFMMMKEEEKE